MKKRILFVCPSYRIGGTTVSTKNLILLLREQGYDCYVLPLKPYGELKMLYDNVQKVNTPFAVKSLIADKWNEKGSIINRIRAIHFRIIRFIFSDWADRLLGRALNRAIKPFSFDTVVACQEGTTTRLVSYVRHPNKVAWIRCDYKRLFDRSKQKDAYYDSFKSIVCVAEETCNRFKTIYPEYADKTFCIPNPQASSFLKERAKEAIQEPRFLNDKFTIISVGRLDPVKRFTMIAPIAKTLIESGVDFKWFLIGDGPERKKIEDSIAQYQVGDNVKMLGFQTNPYFFMGRADLLVCLSSSEACPRAVNEAKILGLPTASTDFPTIYEFIEDGETGWICPIEEMAKKISEIMSNQKEYLSVKNNLKDFSFDNEPLLEQIESVLS